MLQNFFRGLDGVTDRAEADAFHVRDFPVREPLCGQKDTAALRFAHFGKCPFQAELKLGRAAVVVLVAFSVSGAFIDDGVQRPAVTVFLPVRAAFPAVGFDDVGADFVVDLDFGGGAVCKVVVDDHVSFLSAWADQKRRDQTKCGR